MGDQQGHIDDVRKDGAVRTGRHRRRRWWVLAAAVGITAILVVVLIPHLLSSGPGTRMVTSVINGRLPGRVAIGDLSLSWTGPTRMTGLKVTDSQGRDVLALDRLDWSGGLLSAMGSPGQLRRIELNAPDVVLHQSPDGTFSIAEALGLARPDDTQRGALPEVSGKVSITGGGLLIKLADGRELAVKSIDAEADIQTLNKIDVRFSATLAEGGAVSGELSVREMLREGEVDLAAAQGRLRARSDEPIQIGPLAGFAFGWGDVSGSLDLKVTGDLTGGSFRGRTDADLTGFRGGGLLPDQKDAIDLSLRAVLASTPDKITAEVNLSGTGIDVEAAAVYRPPAQPLAISMQDLLAAAVDGEPIELPELESELSATIDLPRLANAMPSVLRIRPGLEVTDGQVELAASVTTREGSRGTFSFKAVSLRGTKDGRTVELEPITAEAEIELVEKTGLVLRGGELASSFARLEAAGSASDMRGGFVADLSGLHRQLGEFFDLGVDTLEGDLAGSIRLARTGQDRIDIDLTGTVGGLDYRRGEQTVQLETGRMHYTGSLTFPDRRLGRLEVRQGHVDLDGQIIADMAGWYDFRDESFRADLEVQQADLSEVLALAGGIARWQGTPEVSGRLDLTASIVAADQTVAVKADGRVEDLSWASEKGPISEEQASFALDVRADTKAERIDVQDFDLRGETLSARLTGSVREYKTDRILDLTGRYEGSWQRMTALLHQLAPQTSQTVALSGRTAGDITITGPARQLELRPVYRGVAAGTDLGWSSGEVYGLELSEASFSPVLKEGRISLPVTAIGASGGMLRLGGVVDLQTEEHVLTIPQGLQVLEKVRIDQDLSHQLLSRFNPIFSDVAQIDGEVSLLMHHGEFPLGEGFRQGGSGSGRLELQGVRLLPRGLLGRLLELVNVSGSEPMAVSFNQIEFTIADGRIEYDDFTVQIAKLLDLKFRGSVGFDDRVDMAVSVPIVPSLLGRLGASGPLADYARVLTGTRIELPIIGTRLRPRIDFSAVDLTELLREATRTLLLEAPTRILDILRPGETAPGSTTPTEADAPATAPSVPKRRTPQDDLMESLWDLLGEMEKGTPQKDEEGQ